MAEFIIDDQELLERLELYRTQRCAPTLDEALRRLMVNHLPPLPITEEEHLRLMQRLELTQRRQRQAILNRAKCSG